MKKTLKKLISGAAKYRNKSIYTAIIFCGILTISTFSPTLSIAAPREIQEVNYYSSLRADDANVRSGPGTNYPIKFTFKMRGIPVRVISEYDNWNEIEDFDGQSGWVTQSLLTKKRTLITKISKNFTNLHSKPNEKSQIIFRLENQVVGSYLKCEQDWCAMKVDGKKGWVQKEDLFGHL
jgi:SH3-like domain-containing protein